MSSVPLNKAMSSPSALTGQPNAGISAMLARRMTEKSDASSSKAASAADERDARVSRESYYSDSDRIHLLISLVILPVEKEPAEQVWLGLQ